jgi:hypothetical protein
MSNIWIELHTRYINKMFNSKEKSRVAHDADNPYQSAPPGLEHEDQTDDDTQQTQADPKPPSVPEPPEETGRGMSIFVDAPGDSQPGCDGIVDHLGQKITSASMSRENAEAGYLPC